MSSLVVAVTSTMKHSHLVSVAFISCAIHSASCLQTNYGVVEVRFPTVIVDECTQAAETAALAPWRLLCSPLPLRSVKILMNL